MNQLRVSQKQLYLLHKQITSQIGLGHLISFDFDRLLGLTFQTLIVLKAQFVGIVQKQRAAFFDFQISKQTTKTFSGIPERK